MNEPSYFLCWLYLSDMHNLDVEGMAACSSDPRSDYRWDNLVIKEADVSILRSVDDVVESMRWWKSRLMNLLCLFANRVVRH